jgi:glycosyltransferase involved in cell wall biosynthesis
MDKKISIIVPVYKVEEFLGRCVDSLVNQTYRNIEIILVDDKSPDKCPEICDALAKTDSRIKVIHKEKNEGLGFARNTGIDNASGDYILFIDSDDYLSLKTCEITKAKLDETKSDICCFCCADIYKDKIVNNTVTENELIFENDEIITSFLPRCIASDESSGESEIGISANMVLYKASLFETGTLRFVSEREFVNEDLLFRIELCKYVKKAIVLPDNLYFYFHNSGTLTTNYKENRFEASCKIFNKVNAMIEDLNCRELYIRNIRYLMLNTMVSIKMEVAKYGFSSIKTIKEICNSETLIDALKQYNISDMPTSYKLFFNKLKAKRAFAVFILVKASLLTNRKKIS